MVMRALPRQHKTNRLMKRYRTSFSNSWTSRRNQQRLGSELKIAILTSCLSPPAHHHVYKFYNVDLQAIHNHSDVLLLDDIDKLRSHGISQFVALPQLIVCCDQSSGKSSVLEAISGIPFPTKDNLCTRFATEVILRRTSKEQISVRISPGPERQESERTRLEDFRESISELERFEDVVEKATSCMGLNKTGAAFADDVLRVDISGPELPHLTIVDLPGLIHSHNRAQSTEDVQVVQSLVRRYMANRRSIILAIVSAKNDSANQIVLKMAREVDPQGRRTLGVITKPDTLPNGSESEAAFLNLAKNMDVSFELGWHVLKNRSYESRHSSLAERNKDEAAFPLQGVWSQLPRSSVAIATLRPRLSRVLLEQVKRELPAVVDDIERRLEECRTGLRKLGQRRRTLDEQGRFLFHLAQGYQNLARAATDGVYGDSFFGDPRTDSGYSKRIRAVVQNLSLNYAEKMRRNGHRYHITADKLIPPNTDPTIEQPTLLSRSAYLEHAKALLTRSRGRELPGTFNPLVIADLFHEQSTYWSNLSQGYVDAVWAATRSFVESVLLHLTQEETASSIMQEVMDPIMEDKIGQISKNVNSIIEQYRQGHPITYNHYFTETIQNVRAKRMEDDLAQRLRKLLGDHSGESLEELNRAKIRKSSLISALTIRNEADMDLYACAEAMDCMFAFYKVAMKAVVDNVAIQCVESQLIKILPEIFSPATVLEIDADKISKVAEESSFSADQREQLLAEEHILEAGLETCRRHVTARGFTKASNPQVSVNSLLRTSRSSSNSSCSYSGTDDPQADDDLVNNVRNDAQIEIAQEENDPVVQETQARVEEPPTSPAWNFQEISPHKAFSFGSDLSFNQPESASVGKLGKKKKKKIVSNMIDQI